MAIPYTKAQLLALANTYITGSNYPNIQASELLDLDTRILDRVDGRVLQTGTFTIANMNGYYEHTIYISPAAYTSQYIVMVTPLGAAPTNYSHRTTFAITNRTTTQFTILMQTNGYVGNARFWYSVFSKVPL
jgi:hypothetical protein